MARWKRKSKISIRPLKKILDAPINDQFRIFIKIRAQLVPEERHRLKRKGRTLYPLPLMETYAEAIEAHWKKQAILALQEHDYFNWPSTKAWFGHGSLTQINSPEEGILSLFGYNVNQEYNLDSRTRRCLLDDIFSVSLPLLYPKMNDDWGNPKSAKRLLKMANCLASFCRNAKRRRSSDLALAIERWESDLSYLKQRYYIEHFRFEWPTSKLDYNK